jgi:hypothetical protein
LQAEPANEQRIEVAKRRFIFSENLKLLILKEYDVLDSIQNIL